MNKAEKFLNSKEIIDIKIEFGDIRKSFKRVEGRKLSDVLESYLQHRVNEKPFSLSEFDSIVEDIRNHKLTTFDGRVKLLMLLHRNLEQEIADRVNKITDELFEKYQCTNTSVVGNVINEFKNKILKP